MTSTTQNGRAVYAHTSGSKYLFFWASASDWYVSDDYTVNTAALLSKGDDNTQCPEDEGDSWSYATGGTWQSGSVEVKCVFTQYEVLVTEGATCAAGNEITSSADCTAAIAEANAAIGKPGYGTAGTNSY